MPQFRWTAIKYDVALAREVISCRPTKLPEWVEVAGRLSKDFSSDGKAVDLKGRGCRERMERLLEKFKAEDSKSLKRSGTEEEYDELTQLLEDIASYQRDVESVLNQDKKEKRKKEVEDKRKAEEMRNSAMTTMSSRKRRASESVSVESSFVSIDSDEEGIEEDEIVGRGKGKDSKNRRMSKLSAVEMMQTKFDVNSGLRARELELKKEELQLMTRKMDREDEDKKRAAEERDQRMEMERRRMDLEEKERKQAAEERERRMQMEFAERKVMLDLLTKLAGRGKD